MPDWTYLAGTAGYGEARSQSQTWHFSCQGGDSQQTYAPQESELRLPQLENPDPEAAIR